MRKRDRHADRVAGINERIRMAPFTPRSGTATFFETARETNTVTSRDISLRPISNAPVTRVVGRAARPALD